MPELPSISAAVDHVRQGRISPCDLVEACLEKIRGHDNAIRAWVLVDEQGARRQAEAVAARVAAGDTEGRLLGVPIGVKDIIDVAGWPTKAGSPLRENHVAQRDAPLVAQLRDAGAIILGKTVTTEFACFDPPPTRNPWNPLHTPGGSSSGSAAAVAMQMCMAAIGTQTGGSITRPASYCGVAGLKPTFGRVSTEGVVPLSRHLDHVGPLARSCDDLNEVWMVLQQTTADQAPSESTFDGLEAFGVLKETGALPAGRNPLARMACLRRFFWDRADESVRLATDSALELLRQAGAEVLDVELPASFDQVHQMHRRIMAIEAAEVHREQFGKFPDQFGANIGALIEEGLRISQAEYAEALAHQAKFIADMQAWFEQATFFLLATPATVTPAPASLETTGDPLFNSPFSYCGLPTVSIPCGLTPEGLPCGLQLIAPRYHEPLLLAVAERCERRLRSQLFAQLA